MFFLCSVEEMGLANGLCTTGVKTSLSHEISLVEDLKNKGSAVYTQPGRRQFNLLFL